jgi:hypothetical protein
LRTQDAADDQELSAVIPSASAKAAQMHTS